MPASHLADLAGAAMARHREGRLDEAIGLYLRMIGVAPDFAGAHANLGAALQDLGRLAEATGALRQAILRQPDHPEAYTNLGNLRLSLGQPAEAVALHVRSLRVEPSLFQAHGNLAAALKDAGRLDEAVAAGRAAAALSPDYAQGCNNLAAALAGAGRLGEALRWYGAAAHLRPADVRFARNVLSCALYCDDLDDRQLDVFHRKFGIAFASPPVSRPRTDPTPGRRLRIGYLSADLRDHPVAGNLLPVLRRHDRAAVSLHFYANLCKPDAVTERFRALADGWCDIAGLSDAEVAERITADGIDILVCLAGHFDDNRPTVCAHRPAPVQISLHDVATSGLAEMDYIIGDRWLLPKGSAEFFSERPLRLPQFYVIDFPVGLPPMATERRPGPPVFGCFNNPMKITPAVLGLWGRILAAAPGSRLLLKFRSAYRSPDLRRRCVEALTACGGAADQVVFAPREAPIGSFIAAYNDIDVALDPFPFSGSTTTFQALVMGVPVVTLPGGRMVSRWTAAMLHGAGLDELIAADEEAYVAIALGVARQAAAWRARRPAIRARLAASRLCDEAGWARHLERLYRAVWRRWCARVGQMQSAVAPPMVGSASNSTVAPASLPMPAAEPRDSSGQLAGCAGTPARRPVPRESCPASSHFHPTKSSTADLAGLIRMATSMHAEGRLGEAEQAYRGLLDLAPERADLHCNLGAALRGLGQLNEAIDQFTTALSLQADYPEAHHNLGEALLARDGAGRAVGCCRRALVIKPEYADAHVTLGNAIGRSGRPDQAVAAFGRALLLRPGDEVATNNLGQALVEQADMRQTKDRLEDAADGYRRAIVIRPDRPEAFNNLGMALLAGGLADAARQRCERALRLAPQYPGVHRNLLLCAAYSDDADSVAAESATARFARAFCRPAGPAPTNDPTPHRRLKVGYLTADARSHPVGANLLPVIRHHDRTAVSVHFYADVQRPDAVTERFRALADGWRDIRGLSDSEVAGRIRADEIDILVSLASRFDDNRPTVCAYRAAPVQISMHDVATSGLAEMDYIVGDRWLLPRGGPELFTERPLRLPQFYLADLPADLPPIETMRRPGPPVFGCFNNPAKISPSVLRLWGRLLAAAPGGQLMLQFRGAYRSAELRERVRDQLVQAGADGRQVVFHTEMQPFADFLARHNDVDVALDTFPFSGSTTSYQALLMGVPVVTLPGPRMASRWTAAMLHGLGLEELIAADQAAYVAIALKAAGQSWRARRLAIRERLAASPLCDGAAWARHVERLYRAVWRRWCVGRMQSTIADLPDLIGLATSLHGEGRLEHAVQAYRECLALAPERADLHCNLGAALKGLGQLDEAIAAYRQAIRWRPGFAVALSNLGAALDGQGRYDESVRICRHAIACAADLPQSYYNLGNSLRATGKLADAATAQRRAVVVQPLYPAALSNLGATYLEQRAYGRAVAACRQAAAVAPGEPEPYANLGAALMETNRLDEAAAACRRAIAANSDYPDGHNNLGAVRQRQARAAEAFSCFRAAHRLRSGDLGYFRNLLSSALYNDELDNRELADLHHRFGAAFGRPVAALAVADPGRRRLKVAYLSSDFRDHPVAGNCLPFLRRHDRTAFSLHFYADVAEPDAVTEEFRRLADGWCDIGRMTDGQVAERVRADGIDILVSLAGHFDGNRPTVCAWRAAPVQISLYDGATSGLAEMDYLLADSRLVATNGAEYFSERPLRLPQLFVYDVPDDLPDIAAGRPPGPPVFGCFNNPAKISPSALRLWGRILAALPGSRLVLGYMDRYRPDALRLHFLAALAAAGASDGQVVFLADREPPAVFLGRYNAIDVALDTMPFSGSTTSFHALAMGVPVVTRRSERMIGRMTAAMVQGLGLAELIADDDDTYVAIALSAAADAAAWRRRRGEIRRRLAESSLCDGPRRARQIERLYRAVWTRAAKRGER
jgi:predicted O-linked N-acetylglucosamine transferase (SPINDLY family)